MQRRKKFLDTLIGDAVPKRTRIASERNDALVAHLPKVLRQRGLTNSDGSHERAHRRLAALHEPAQNHQTPLVGERSEDARYLGRPFFKAPQIRCN